MSKKHFILLLPALLLLGGCETRDKVVSFWAGQAQKLMTTPYGMMMLMGAMQYGAKAHKNLDILNMPQGAEENIPWLQGMQSLPAGNALEPRTEPNAAPAKNTQRAAAKPKPQPQQFMEISIEGETPEFKGLASEKDQRAMQQGIDFIKNTNQQALGDVQRLMGNAARDEVILLNTRTEKKLEKASLQAKTLKQYQQQQNIILQQHKTQFQKILAKYQHKLNS